MELTPQQLQAEWKSGKFRPVYYLFGEDASARTAAAAALKAKLQPDPFNLNELGADGAEEAVSAALTPPVFADRRLVVVRDGNLPAAARKTLAAYLSDPLESTTLVLHSDERKPDPRDALAAAAGKLGGLVVFRPLSEDEAVRRLEAAAKEAGFALDEEAAHWIVEEAGTSWGILKSELAKLILFAKGRKTLGREDALACLGYKQSSNPFDFPRWIQARDRKKALEHLRRLLAEGADEFRLLYQVTGAVNKQLKAKRLRAAGTPEAQIFRELRLNAYFDKDYLRQADAVAEAALLRDLNACLETEAALKSKSWLDPAIELERLVAGICAPRRAG